jgi:hypothetical protein
MIHAFDEHLMLLFVAGIELEVNIHLHTKDALVLHPSDPDL